MGARPPRRGELPPNAENCVFAHSANQAGQRHSLVDHLVDTGERAAEFGEAFGAADSCRVAGNWHDIGKVNPDFQAYLTACEQGGPHSRVDHKTAGAVLAAETPEVRHVVQVILGHHGGMPDCGDARSVIQQRRNDAAVQGALAWARATLPAAQATAVLTLGDAPELDTRMRLLFSAVVDADFLDTEAHFNADCSLARSWGRRPTVDELVERETAAHARFLAARAGASSVDGVRAEVRTAALAASQLEPGLFRLTVPTGGGKTRAALAFALRHAMHHNLRRVVTAVPFITVTDQTAKVYREVLGGSTVLEHHSGIDPDAASADPKQRLWGRLAAENWDSPVIVTTTVQLFESLFSNRPSALRKAHRLARSVIILDEVQTLRLSVLGVTVDMLAALTRVASTSVVLCTATQPALEEVAGLTPGHIREIVPDVEAHARALRRVTFSIPARSGPWSWARVAAGAMAEEQSLVIVNRRRDALAVLAMMGRGTFHLSTLLCGAHRRRVLADVHQRLAGARLCRLVATQVVEAGVDLDFPLVLRALASFDSVVQAAGRCNREGRLPEGRCIVFRPEETDTFGEYRRGQQTMVNMLEGELDFGSPRDCQHYFSALYGKGSEAEATVDPDGLRGHVRDLRFATVASRYRLIDDVGEPVVVSYPPARRRVGALLARMDAGTDPGEARLVMRLLQPYLVSLRESDIRRGQERGLISRRGGVAVWVAPYDMVTGVGAVLLDPSNG